MTQIIGVIALDPFAGKAYASQVRQVFGSTRWFGITALWMALWGRWTGATFI